MSLRLVAFGAMAVVLTVVLWRVRKARAAARADGHNITAAQVLDMLLGFVWYGLVLAAILVTLNALALMWAQDAIEGEAVLSEDVCHTVREQLIAARAFRSADVRTFELAVAAAEARIASIEERRVQLAESGLTEAGRQFVATWLDQDSDLAHDELLINDAELAARRARQREIDAIKLPECARD